VARFIYHIQELAHSGIHRLVKLEVEDQQLPRLYSSQQLPDPSVDHGPATRTARVAKATFSPDPLLPLQLSLLLRRSIGLEPGVLHEFQTPDYF
jgi:hypothetical protein